MERSFNILKVARQNMLHLVSELSDEQLNIIPASYNNNLIWNMGHVIVTQQLLCYNLSGLSCNVSEDMIAKYRKGSRPEGAINHAEIERIKALMLSTVDLIEEDWKAGKFLLYKSYKTGFDFELNSATDAIEFNNVHEAMHLGYCQAIKKLI